MACRHTSKKPLPEPIMTKASEAYGITKSQQVNSYLPGQNGCYFADDNFRCIFVNENRILIKISLKFVPYGPTDDKPALV